MKVCRKCGSKYFGGEVFCSLDGEPLGDQAGAPGDAPAQARPEHTDPFIGKQIEKYDIIRRLGEGGMGEVYEARHVHIGKRVALKVLREDFSRKEEVVERFRQEARSASIIGHENIIDITDFGTTPDGRFFFVMEYLDGEDLAGVFEKQRTIPYERALRILKQACEGLVAAHSKGIIHRDLKPENIYLVAAGQPNEQVKILDFGIAKMSVLDGEGRKLTKTGVVFGTPEYMSPEQAGGKPVDNRIDVYAMGIIMFEMFTGNVPFSGDTFMAVLSRHMFEPVPDMRTRNANLSIPRSMESIVHRALEKDPDKRFASMQELLDALIAVEKDPATVPFAPAPGGQRDPAMTTPGPVLEVIGDVDDHESAPRTGRGLVWALVILLVVAGLGVGAAVALPRVFGVDLVKLATGGPDTAVPGAASRQPETDDRAATDGAVDPMTHGMPSGMVPDEAEDEVAPLLVVVKISSDPEGASVEAEGRGKLCDLTPCEVTATRDEKLVLTVTRGKLSATETLTASSDPTEVMVTLKAGKKPVKGAKKDPEETPVPEPPPKKAGSVDMGELKVPDVYKKDK